jgi:hypothetical protein
VHAAIVAGEPAEGFDKAEKFTTATNRDMFLARLDKVIAKLRKGDEMKEPNKEVK